MGTQEGEGPKDTTQESATDRLRLVMGKARLARVQAARVMVVGLGGVGSNCAEALARGGVGRPPAHPPLRRSVEDTSELQCRCGMWDCGVWV